jgi:hypothetical protein
MIKCEIYKQKRRLIKGNSEASGGRAEHTNTRSANGSVTMETNNRLHTRRRLSTMKRIAEIIGIGLLLAGMNLLMYGCGSSPMNPSTGNSYDEIMTSLDGLGLWENYFGNDRIMDFHANLEEMTTDSPIEPVCFYRLLGSPERSIDIEFEGDKAFATLDFNVNGQLVLECEDETYYKDISNDVGRRYAELEKEEDEWVVTRVTPLKGHSGGVFPEIYVVRVASASIDTTFDSFDALQDIDVLTFDPGEEVWVYAFVRDSTDVAILHHLDDKCVWGHRVMEHQGYGLFVSQYYANYKRGERFYQFVDVIDRETLLDDEAPYRAAAWTMPYYIREE